MDSIRWQWNETQRLVMNAEAAGVPLFYRGEMGLVSVGLWDAAKRWCRHHCGDRLAPTDDSHTVTSRVTQRLESVYTADDLLVTEVEITNRSALAEDVHLAFGSSARPTPSNGQDHVHLPLTMAGILQHWAIRSVITDKPLATPAVWLGRPGEGYAEVECHYLEPRASGCDAVRTAAPLLIPLVDHYQPAIPLRIAMFSTPTRGWRIRFCGSQRGGGGTAFETRLRLEPGQTVREQFFFLLHTRDVPEAWRAFHAHAHHDEFTAPGWLQEVRVHYYDFLGPGGPAARRGLGFEDDLPLLGEFGVGLYTQHGYYQGLGDYLQPGRDAWLAMPMDANGGFPMSVAEIQRRCERLRQARVHPAIYLHSAAFDVASPGAMDLREAVVVGEDGRLLELSYWKGPETRATLWHMSLAAAPWREHLLRQATLIMERLNPDALVMDESFAGLGHDYHPDRAGPISTGARLFYNDLRRLVRSFGDDKAVLVSDVALSSFVLWADGEAGDHGYDCALGHPVYRQEPVPYLAALGGKRWLPCSWQPVAYWEQQMDLALKTGAGVGVSNGWIEYSGLARLHPVFRQRMLADIASLKTVTNSKGGR